MKKIIFFLSFLLLCSCTVKNEYKYEVKTIIEENINTYIAINYPKTNINKINKKIEKYINNSYENFLKEYNNLTLLNKKYELNIDYNYYNLNNKYLSIIIYKHISSTDDTYINNEIFTYIYDTNKRKKINFNQIINDTEKNNITDLLKNLLLEKYGEITNLDKILSICFDKFNFTINNDYVTIYFEGNEISNSTQEILSIEIPLNYFEKLKNLKTTVNITPINISPTINYIDINKPVVALTFDDGPSKYTEDILKTLEEYDSNATFFVLGNKIEAYNDIISNMYKNGNEIGNHTYNHRWLTKLSPEEQREQISKTQEIIKKYTGYTPTYLRPTYGSVNQKLRNNTNLKIMLWNIDTKDWKYKSVDTIVNNALKNVKDGSIILMHDTYKRTSDAVKIIVPKLIENGYQLVTVSELQEIQKLRNNLNETG